MAPKSTFILSESPFWPKLPLSSVSFGAQRVMVSNGSLNEMGGLRKVSLKEMRQLKESLNEMRRLRTVSLNEMGRLR